MVKLMAIIAIMRAIPVVKIVLKAVEFANEIANGATGIFMVSV